MKHILTDTIPCNDKLYIMYNNILITKLLIFISLLIKLTKAKAYFNEQKKYIRYIKDARQIIWRLHFRLKRGEFYLDNVDFFCARLALTYSGKEDCFFLCCQSSWTLRLVHDSILDGCTCRSHVITRRAVTG